ncbi:LacI family DNA-binding transcriptional regulator [Cohaesibacter celericrescens]|uniref:HTH lacI-type domain-containing protein n=1 Tax=Cohaesibacter celericrescens TaxID=2067669 RepID=A0A2N5XU95_9HYPH|nr:LacI family DNA-binding transcriptional regulator [Cohaesibacter celericrescens]PLW77988.1 hypothetical protein C0081_06875 [Cohaesibacter celericrescens]
MPTLLDIANEVGVSSKTVSLTLRGKKCASEETTLQILKVAERTGYVPRRSAQMSLGKGTPLIGFFADRETMFPHSFDLLRGAQAAASELGCLLLIGSLDDAEKNRSDIWQMFRDSHTAGVVYASLFHQEVDRISSDVKNVVYANCFAQGCTDRAILPDDEAGGYEQAAYLVKLGHTRIGVISLPERAPATNLRLTGANRALSAHGMALDPDLCCAGVEGYLPEGETYVAYESAKTLLDRPDRPTAIICGNDRIALMVMSAAAHMGLRVPEDLSVIGFDDFQAISEVVRPRLTTVGLPYFEMGKRAIIAVMSHASTPELFNPEPCLLIERDSCAPLG